MISIQPFVAQTPVTPAARRETPQEAATAAPSPASTLPPLRVLQGADIAAATADFAADLNDLFRRNGISVPPEVLLGRDSTGHVKVSGAHPDKARIEALFEADFDLRNRYGEIASAHMLQRAVEGYDDFVTQYQRLQGSPAAQEALVQARIARNSAPFALVVGTHGAEGVFGGLSLRA